MTLISEISQQIWGTKLGWNDAPCCCGAHHTVAEDKVGEGVDSPRICLAVLPDNCRCRVPPSSIFNAFWERVEAEGAHHLECTLPILLHRKTVILVDPPIIEVELETVKETGWDVNDLEHALVAVLDERPESSARRPDAVNAEARPVGPNQRVEAKPANEALLLHLRPASLEAPDDTLEIGRAHV